MPVQLGRIIHDKKHFAELEDGDVEMFLRERKFGSEHLNIEFKNAFPQKGKNKYDIKKICKYIVGFSNEEGGLVAYGVADDIKDHKVPFPDYISGLNDHPSAEDLSQWVTDRIHPLIASPAIRFFSVASKKVAVLKIPSGVNKPYCYYDHESHSVTFFKKTSAGIRELNPHEIREFYRTQIIEQSQLILRSAEVQGTSPSVTQKSSPDRVVHHKSIILAKLEDPKDFGLVCIYCLPGDKVEIPFAELKKLVEDHRYRFSEAMRFAPNIDVYQDGVSIGYFPRAVRQDVKSTMRTSLYVDGFVAFDALADTFLDGDKQLHSGWLCYEIQRQLQLTKAVLKGRNAIHICLTVALGHIEAFKLGIAMGSWAEYAPYAGANQPITRELKLDEIYDFDGDKRNVVMPVVRDIMDEVGRIFGLSQAPPNLWDTSGHIIYVKGLEGER